MLAELIGLVIAALFTGAAFYINFAEQPARLQLDDAALLTQWKPAYKRGFVMQASLAVAGFLCGLAAFGAEGDGQALAAGLVMLANWPYTLLGIMPTNNRLMATEPSAAGPQTRRLIEHWGRLHAVRTALGALGVLLFLAALTGEP
ncbi:DUF1772 domain-containing protein [Bosea sp. 117]|uniref:DUF1772 domain-containing protein n=1 Tax=Bosea sp. 117 TaxID=1125973 RepID=UPI0004947D67|nr:DUF1772 domain-containing protein [Bosea sp. 117]